MPTLFIHGIGNHDLQQFHETFFLVRRRLRASLAERRGVAPPESAFFPVFWGDWGPHTRYSGRVLSPAVQAKAIAPDFDPGLDALKTILSTPGPLKEVLDDLEISESDLLRAAGPTLGEPERAAATVRRLAVRTSLNMAGRTMRRSRTESWEALRELLTLILDPPRAVSKGLPPVVSYPFWATMTALTRHMRGSIMQAATDFIGDVMAYLAHGAEVRQMLHAAVRQACAAYPGEPLTIIGHSLGGIIAYQYTADPTLLDRPPIALLATVGTQVGLWHEYGLLDNQRTAAARWLNIYDPDDFLSFPASGLFPHHVVADRALSSGKPFPASHSAYWENEQVYTAISELFPA